MQGGEDFVRISFRHEEFRCLFSPPFTVVLVCVLFVSEAFFLLVGTASLQVLLLLLPLTVVLLCATAVGLMCLMFKFEVGPAGIQGYDFWSRKHCIDWGTVSRVRHVSLLGLDYLRLEIHDSRRILWVPLFVERYDLLRDLLSIYLDESHDLREKLARVAT